MTVPVAAGGSRWTRRALLRHGGSGLLALAGTGVVTGCGASSAGTWLARPEVPAAEDLTGPFSWRRCAGQEVRALLPDHPATTALVADLERFHRRTGITARVDVVPPQHYDRRVSEVLLRGAAGTDVVVTTPATTWPYVAPGWLEDLRPWLASTSATAGDHDFEDVPPTLRVALQWDLVKGTPVGSGGQWAVPWAWEPTLLVHQARDFARLGLQPPRTFDELEDVAAAYSRMAPRITGRPAAGFTAPGTRASTTVQPGFSTQLAREGGRDFVRLGAQLVPAVDRPRSVAFHQEWARVLRDSGPRGWSRTGPRDCGRALLDRTAGMAYATGVPLPVAGGPDADSALDGLGWSAGPRGRDGSLSTDLVVHGLAVHARSRSKVAAWLLLQWATGSEHLLRTALVGRAGHPVRLSVATDPAYRRLAGRRRGYLEAVEEVIPHSRVLATPQRRWFEASGLWVDALRRIHEGEDAGAALELLAAELTQRI